MVSRRPATAASLLPLRRAREAHPGPARARAAAVAHPAASRHPQLPQEPPPAAVEPQPRVRRAAAGEPPLAGPAPPLSSFPPSLSLPRSHLSPFPRSADPQPWPPPCCVTPSARENGGIRPSPAHLRRIRPPRRRPLPARRRGRPVAAAVRSAGRRRLRERASAGARPAPCRPIQRGLTSLSTRPNPAPRPSSARTGLLRPRPGQPQPQTSPSHGPGPLEFRKRSECEDSSNTLARLLHGLVLLPSGISGTRRSWSGKGRAI